MSINANQTSNFSFRHAGIAIAGATLLSMLAVSMHPGVSNAHTPQDAINQIAAYALHDEFIHGLLILLLAATAAGFSVFGDMLGAHRHSVRFGKTAYLFGYGAMTAAMLFDGFAVPLFARQFTGANAIDAQTASIVLQVIGVFIQVFTKAGIIAMSVAIVGWAYALHSDATMSTWSRKFAWIAYAAGLISIGIILFANVWLGPHNLVAIFSAHAIWNLCAAAILLHAAKTAEHQQAFARSSIQHN